MRLLPALLGFVVLLTANQGALSDTLRVGADEQYKQPSDALAAATDGDTIEIAEGEYFNCSRVTADHLTIIGLGAVATLSDATCDGKALLVIRSDAVTIRNITFARARVADGNGAGIRAEGRDLTIDRARFVNNQAAILAAASPHGTIVVTNSRFESNGNCFASGRCVGTIQVGELARLHVEKCVLTNPRGGMLIASGARRTELYSNTIEDGPEGRSSGLVQVSVGALVAEENRLRKTAPYQNRKAAIFMLPSGAPLGDLALRQNIYENGTGEASALLISYAGGDLAVAGNTIPPGDDEVSTDGIMRYRASLLYHASKDFALDTAQLLKWSVKVLLGRQ